MNEYKIVYRFFATMNEEIVKGDSLDSVKYQFFMENPGSTIISIEKVEFLTE